MATFRTWTTLPASVAVLALLCFAVAPGHAGESRRPPAAFADGASTANSVLADTLIAKGEKSLDQLRALIADKQPAGRAYELFTFARLLRALGRTDAAFVKRLRAEAEGAEDADVRKFAEAALDVLGTATPLGQGREDGRSLSPRKLVAALTDGNDHRVANNVLVDQLLLRGEEAVEPLLVACKDPGSKAPFYAAWALAKVLRATGRRPEDAVRMFKDRYDPDRSPRSILGL